MTSAWEIQVYNVPQLYLGCELIFVPPTAFYYCVVHVTQVVIELRRVTIPWFASELF